MKIIKKLLAMSLAIVSVVCIFTGCKKEDKNTLTITVSELGFGTEWLYSIASEFERINNCNVEIHPTVIAKDLLSQLEVGYQMDDLLMFAGVDAVWETMRKYMTNASSQFILDDDGNPIHNFITLDDIWDSYAEGEDKKLSEKVIPEYIDIYKSMDGHYYSVPFITEMAGMAYNKTALNAIFGTGKWQLPKTTYELDVLAEKIKKEDAYTFTWSNKENAYYWNNVCNVWSAQYDGYENYVQMQHGKVFDEITGEYIVDIDHKTMDYKGRLKAYQVCKPYIKDSNLGGYSHHYATSMQFAESQAAFAGTPYANDRKKVAFTPNGSWLYEESKEDFEYRLADVGIMNVPITSTLSELLSYYDVNDGEFVNLDSTKKAKYDKALVAIIDYLNDVVVQKPTVVDGLTITQADIDRVNEALNIAQIKDQAHALIPSNAKNIDLAKKFLLFFATDYAGQIYSSVTHGFNPFHVTLDEDNMDFYTTFDKDVYSILSSTNKKICNYTKTGFNITLQAPEGYFFTDSGTYSTPDKLFAKYTSANISTWQDKLSNAGLAK